MEIDLVAELADGTALTGSVKCSAAPIRNDVHRSHMNMLERAAHAGRTWAPQALESDASILYVAAGGFTDDFIEAVESVEQRVTSGRWKMSMSPFDVGPEVLFPAAYRRRR